MCGIVAVVSNENVLKKIIRMLRRLEYRGYDSSGVSISSNEKLHLFKKTGGLDNLVELIDGREVEGFNGIGHTRWATHGKPNDINSHPHMSNSKTVSIVHNGIIENYNELFDEIKQHGITRHTETDSEVISHLIEIFINNKKDYTNKDLVKYLSRKLKGAYSLAIQIKGKDEQIIGLKNQCPLNFLDKKDFKALSSDIASLALYSDKIGVLQDEQAIVITKNSLSIFSFDGVDIAPSYMEIDMEAEDLSMDGYKTFLRKEISDEPYAISSLQNSLLSQKDEFTSFFPSDKSISKVIYLACGSASFSCNFSSIYARKIGLNIDFISDIGSEFRYKPFKLDGDTLFIAVSQSGETADTIGSVELAIQNNSKIMSFVNVAGSTLDQKSDVSIKLGAGPEVAVPSSKAVVNQFLASILPVMYLTNRDIGVEKWNEGCNKVKNIIEKIILNENTWQRIAKTISGHQSSFALGRGLDFPIALEMALKFKETAYIHCEAMYAGEFKHGSISLIEHGMPVFCFLGDHDVRDKSISNIQEIHARGAQVFIFDSAKNDDINLSNLGEYFNIGFLDSPWSSIAFLTITHLVSYHAGLIRKVNVDRPRNLAKSVTVE